jgi:hypothetical protein
MGGAGGGNACPRIAGPDDAARFLVVGHPFDAAGNAATDYEVLALSKAGDVTATGTHFTMGKAADRPIVFTPDGKVGIATQDDGSLGVFRVDATGKVDVLSASFKGAFYADRVVMSEAGDHVWVIDPDFQASGGGIYRVDIGCDDLPVDKGLVLATKSASAIAPIGNGEVVLAAKEVMGSAMGDTAARVTLSPTPSFKAGVDTFGDDQAIISWVTTTHDKKFALVGDNSAFANVPNRVAFLSLGGGGLSVAGVLPMIEDPYAIVASPFDDAAIVVSGFGDAIFVLDYTPAKSPAFALKGKLQYVNGKPQVPGSAVMIERGTLKGRVFVSEVRGLFQVAFKGGGVVNDVGLFDLNGGTESIVEGVGVQP